MIWSVKSWTLNFWSVIWKKLISGWFSWSLILLNLDLWWTLICWSVEQVDLWSLISFDPCKWTFDLVDLWTLIFRSKQISFVKQYCCGANLLQKVLFVDTVGMARRFFQFQKKIRSLLFWGAAFFSRKTEPKLLWNRRLNMLGGKFDDTHDSKTNEKKNVESN